MSVQTRHRARHYLRFSGLVIAVIATVLAAFWAIGALFAISKWLGALSLSVLAIVLFATAHRWVRWLPGILIFGVLNSLVGLVSRAPTNPVNVSTGLACLILAFYLVGCLTSYFADHVSVFDRLAWVAYLFLMFIPAAFPSSNGGVVTRVVALPYVLGMTLAIMTYVHRRFASYKNGG